MQLDNHSGSSEAEILKRISAARQQSEPSEPTENVEAEASDDAIAEEVETEEAVKTEESEEIEAADSDEPHDSLDEGKESQEDEFYIELGDEEIPLSQIEEWKSGYMKDKDYRQKTMALAEQRKQFDAEREQFNEMQNQLKERIVELEAIVTEDDSSIDWDDLREYDPEKYIEQKEKLEKRKKAIEEAKKLRAGPASESNVDAAAESQKLFSKHPEWGSVNDPTEQFEKDAKMIQDYMQKQGFSDQEVKQIQTARAWETVLRAARFDATQTRSDVAKKKVRKAPIVTKPKKSAKTSLQVELEEAQARLKKTGSDADALRVRKLKRQLKR